mmetsp:Transcript_25913/g.46854  ORF Transcript_25913/g.46854 Transcript_25913/m.46854 type:complete len:212 (-) Transcript_25913:46-681(-)
MGLLGVAASPMGDQHGRVLVHLNEKYRTTELGGLQRHFQGRIHQDERARLTAINGVEGSSLPHLGTRHPVNLDNQHDLAIKLANQGRLPEAAELFSNAWQGRLKLLGKDHPLTHQSLREFAELKRRQGDREAAKELLGQSQCHGYSQRHPLAGNGTLVTARTHTHICPKVPRSKRLSNYPTPNPGKPPLDKETIRRSFSMSAEIRCSPFLE